MKGSTGAGVAKQAGTTEATAPMQQRIIGQTQTLSTSLTSNQGTSRSKHVGERNRTCFWPGLCRIVHCNGWINDQAAASPARQSISCLALLTAGLPGCSAPLPGHHATRKAAMQRQQPHACMRNVHWVSSASNGWGAASEHAVLCL
jgi:hypothetical protein